MPATRVMTAGDAAETHRHGGGGQRAGLDLARRRGPVPPHLLRSDASATPGRSTPTPPGSCSSAWAASRACCGSSPGLPKSYEGEVVLGTGHDHARRLGRGDRDVGHVRCHARRRAQGGGVAHRRRGPGPAHGLGAQGGGAAAARAGPGRDRGRAGRPTRHRGALRRGAVARRRARGLSHRGGLLDGDLRPRARRRPGRCPRVAAPTSATCVGPGSARSASTRPTPWRASPRPTSSTPAQALRDLPQVELDDEMARSVSHGLALDRVSVGATGDGPWALLDRSGAAVGGLRSDRHRSMVAACVLAATG